MKYFFILLLGIISINLYSQDFYTLKSDKSLEYYKSQDTLLQIKLQMSYDSLKFEKEEKETVNAFFRLLSVGEYLSACGLIYHDSILINVFDSSDKDVEYVLKLGQNIEENKLKLDLAKYLGSKAKTKESCRIVAYSADIDKLRFKKGDNILIVEGVLSIINSINKRAKKSNIYICYKEKHSLNKASYKLQTDYCINKYAKKNKNGIYVLKYNNDDMGLGKLKFDKIIVQKSNVDINLLKNLKKYTEKNTVLIVDKCFDKCKDCKIAFDKKLLNAGFDIIKYEKYKIESGCGFYKIKLK